MGVNNINPFGLPLLNTLLLLRRAIILTWCHNFFLTNKISSLSLLISIILGLIFLLIQILEYKRATFSISDSTFGTIFFLSTGFHGFHVFLGLLYLRLNLNFLMKKIINLFHHLSFEFSIIY